MSFGQGPCYSPGGSTIIRVSPIVARSHRPGSIAYRRRPDPDLDRRSICLLAVGHANEDDDPLTCSPRSLDVTDGTAQTGALFRELGADLALSGAERVVGSNTYVIKVAHGESRHRGGGG